MNLTLNLLLVSLIQIIMIYAMNALFIEELRNSKYVKMMFLMFILYFISYAYLSVLATGIIWISLVFITIYFSKKIVRSILSVTVSLLLYIFIDYLSSYILEYVPISIDSNYRTFISASLFFLAGYLLNNLFKRKKIFYQKELKIITLVSVLTFVVFFVTIVVERFATDSADKENTNFFFISLYSIISALVAILFVKAVRDRDNAKKKDIEIKQLKNFSIFMESNFDEMKKFQHDYKNILLSMEGYLVDNDIDGLKKYYYTTIAKTSKNFDERLLGFASISKLEIPELKGILIEKMIFSLNTGTKVNIEIPEKVNHINMPILDLVRIAGILLDNAVEATSEVNNAILKIAILKINNYTYFIIYNTISDAIPPLYKLMETGFSTKGKNRGFGLSNIKEIIYHYPQVDIETKIESDSFTQILKVKNS